ncbi:MAG: UDP-N-acetylenolpyruvoylglucosamine reductase [Rhodobiaceae bacterium]|jgi:UDP-N-acetylmuramate dehydrogenase|nr:UDP-N-acetylenolpyruvoylglucosamine reductase [Rhodobiaceae bacterium]
MTIKQDKFFPDGNGLAELKGKILFNKPLENLSWLKVGGPAECLYIPYNLEDLSHFLSYLSPKININVFGRLSNVLIRDGGLSGVTILMPPNFLPINILKGGQISAGAGILDKDLSYQAMCAELGGLEFLSSIPGSIGGAVAMNAGCYGKEIKDIILEGKFIDRKGKISILTKKEIGFLYRGTKLSEGKILIEAIFQGKPSKKEKIRSLIEKINSDRETSQPKGYATGGSTFKNPTEKKAWELIKEAGLQGKKIGGAEVSKKHCNFLINNGEATAKDFEDLGNTIIEEVFSCSGITLEWEIRIVGQHLDR